jgi:tetratricopeptide (TPR) repeat protein
MTTAPETEFDPLLAGRHVAFVGKLGAVTRREAQQLVRAHGGVPVDKSGRHVDLIVIGADEFPLSAEHDLLDQSTREAASEGRVEVIHETQLWQRLGLVENERNVHRLYTPAMLADLLGVSVAVIRRWHRRGLIVPEREVNRLPYFNFQEVATARRLAQLVAAGASSRTIEKKLSDLARYVPDVERPLAQLAVIVEGRQILLRQGEGLIEPGGQRRIDFDALEQPPSGDEGASTAVDGRRQILSLADSLPDSQQLSPRELVELAGQLDDEGQVQASAEFYRAALAAGGPSAEVCFQLAELLYRMGDVTAARERYYMAIELDENFVEARANLGCVLAEIGQGELAVAAFEGALRHHEDYPDVHYHLARALDELERFEEADGHWNRFLALAPDSPWADEARARQRARDATVAPADLLSDPLPPGGD